MSDQPQNEKEAARMDEPFTIRQFLRDESIRRGYRFEISEDGREERLIRPDGTVAIYASRGLR